MFIGFKCFIFFVRILCIHVKAECDISRMLAVRFLFRVAWRLSRPQLRTVSAGGAARSGWTRHPCRIAAGHPWSLSEDQTLTTRTSLHTPNVSSKLC